LTGVVLSAGFGALISLVLTVAPQAQLKSMLYWLMGDLSHAHESATAWLVLAVVLTLFMLLATGLNALALGAIKARALGVPVGSLQAAIYFCAAAATVAAVMLGGSIAFVGMMVPHAMRLVGVTDHRWLLPASAMVGGSFVTLADTFARTIWRSAIAGRCVYGVDWRAGAVTSVITQSMTLSCEHLTVAVGTRALCRDLKLTVATGELWAVLGCNGSGKTTLLHTLAGSPCQRLVRSTSMDVRWPNTVDANSGVRSASCCSAKITNTGVRYPTT
jgi:ABC-type multidrug transport system fused ATPase/permease subunit